MRSSIQKTAGIVLFQWERSGLLLPIKTFLPHNCEECPFSEHNREVDEIYQCVYFKRSYWGYPGVKPPFCRLESLAVNEKAENKKE